MAITGRLALVALLGILAVALAPGWTTVLAVLAALAALVAVDVLLAGSVRGLALTRGGDTSVRLGEAAVVTLVVSNPGRRRVRGVVRDAWTPSAGASPRTQRLDVEAGAARRLLTTVRPTRRGDRGADRVTIRSVGPLGLAARQGAHVVPWTVRALPPFGSRKHLPSRLARLRDLEGRTEVMVRGQGTEFDSLREYVDGDDVRSIDWRATARAADVMVRTWRPERDRRVVLVLDTGRTAAARVGDAPRLDAAMDAALLLAALATRAGDHVDFFAFDRRVRASVRGAEGPPLMAALVESMAPLEAELVETDARAMVTTVLQRERQRALVVLLTALDPAPLREGLLPVLDRLTARHQVVVCSVADPRLEELVEGRGDIDAVYAAASAERARRERADLAHALAFRGVEVVDAPPALVAPALADRYLALKAQGRL